MKDNVKHCAKRHHKRRKFIPQKHWGLFWVLGSCKAEIKTNHSLYFNSINKEEVMTFQSLHSLFTDLMPWVNLLEVLLDSELSKEVSLWILNGLDLTLVSCYFRHLQVSRSDWKTRAQWPRMTLVGEGSTNLIFIKRICIHTYSKSWRNPIWKPNLIHQLCSKTLREHVLLLFKYKTHIAHFRNQPQSFLYYS